MEKVINRLNEISNSNNIGIVSITDKISFATGYMMDNENLTRQEALEVIQRILMWQI